MISCDCDYGDYEWWYAISKDFSVLATKRAKRCCSCKVPLPVGSEVVQVVRWKTSEDGNERNLADWYFCETCGGLAMALRDLDMCFDIDEPLAPQIREYVESYGPL